MVDFKIDEEVDAPAAPAAPAISQRKADRVVLLDPSVISEISSLQTRQVRFDPDQYPEDQELLDSIRKHGNVEPVLVAAVPGLGQGPRYRLLAGERRLRACQLVPCEVRAVVVQGDYPDLLTMVENTGGRQLTSFERMLALDALRKHLNEQGQNPTPVSLAETSGWAYSTVQQLISLYDDSNEILRGLLAKGLAARTVLELKNVFERISLERQYALAEKLDKITFSQAERLRSYVTQGHSPEDALAIILEGDLIQPGIGLVGGDGAINGEAAIVENAGSSQPAQGETAEASAWRSVDVIAEICGVSSDTARHIAQEAQQSGLDQVAVFIACRYVARGGSQDDAVGLTKRALRKRKVKGMLGRYVKTLEYLDNSVRYFQTLDDLDLRAFLEMVVRA